VFAQRRHTPSILILVDITAGEPFDQNVFRCARRTVQTY
jgi:hypothetical protein